MTETLNGSETGSMELHSLEGVATARLLELLMDALGDASTPLDLASKVSALLAEAAGGWCAVWLRDRAGNHLQLAGVSHFDSSRRAATRDLLAGWTPAGFDLSSPANTEHGRSLIVPLVDLEGLNSFFGSAERARVAAQIGSTSALVAPLVHGHSNLGLLMVVSGSYGIPAADRLEPLFGLIRHIASAFAYLDRLAAVRHASQRLSITNLHLHAILDAIPQGVVVSSAPEGRVVSTSRALSELLGKPLDLDLPISLIPKVYGFASPDGEPYHPDQLPWVITARTGSPVKPQEMLILRNGSEPVTVLCSTSPIPGESGELVGAVALLQDISDRKQLELQKDEFLAMVAHELKTPLTAVKGYLQLILRMARRKEMGSMGPKEFGMLEIADRQVTRLSQLVFDLLDFSMIRMGRLDLRCVDFSLTSLAKDLLAQMQEMAPEVVLDLEGSPDSMVRADPHRVEQVLANLVSNAMKATAPGGRVHVKIGRDGDSVITSVHDSGAGIPREIQGRVFDRFYRGPDRSHEGLGLGLYISREIVDAHGGRIWLESEVGVGTTFHFSLPASER